MATRSAMLAGGHRSMLQVMWAQCCWISTGNADLVRLTLIYCNLQSIWKVMRFTLFFGSSRASKHKFPFWDPLLLICPCISIIRSVPHSITLDSVIRGSHSLVMVKNNERTEFWLARSWAASPKKGNSRFDAWGKKSVVLIILQIKLTVMAIKWILQHQN